MKRIGIISIGFFLLVGCGPTNSGGTVTGTITYNNKPVNGATLMLYPAGGGELYTPITADQKGAFSMSDVPPGDYKIIVEGDAGNNGVPPAPPKDSPNAAKMQEALNKMKDTSPPTIPFPPKYTQLQKTDLTCTVKKGETTQLKLELNDKP
jgi:hypothetical protein